MKKITIFTLVFLTSILSLFFLLPNSVHSESCNETEVQLTTRDSKGAIITSMDWQLWTQIGDADGNPVPLSQVVRSNTGVTAYSKIIFDTNRNEDYSGFAIKIYDVNDKVGEFWYYDYHFDCNSYTEIEKNLSDLKIILRDKDGNALKDRRFEVYQQSTDVQSNPIFGSKVSSSLTTESTGVRYLYIAPGTYIVKIPAIDNKFDYVKYDVEINEVQETAFDFTLSNVSVAIRDGEGTLLPDSKFNIYKQSEDVDGEFILGDYVGRYNTGVLGITDIFLPTDDYAFRFDGESGQFHYLWNQPIDEERSYIVDYKLSNVSIVVRDASNNLLTDYSFDIYNQGQDVDGNNILGEHIGRFDTGVTGVTSVFLPSDTYVIRFDGSGKQYHFLWDQEIESSRNYNITYKLTTLKVTLTGIGDQLLNSVKIIVYKQSSNDNNKNIFGSKLVEVATDSGGNATFYLPADVYALEIVGPDRKTYNIWQIDLNEFDLKKVNYKLSGLEIILKNGNDELVTDTKIEIYKQLFDAKGDPILGKLIGSKSTGDIGQAIFYYPPEKYAIKVKGTSKLDYIFWNKDVADQKIDKFDLVLSGLRLVSRDSDGNLTTDVAIRVANQDQDFEGNPILGSTLVQANTGNKGFIDIYLPAGVYALITDSETRFDVHVANFSLTTVEVRKIGEAVNIESIKESAPSVDNDLEDEVFTEDTSISDAEEALKERIRRLEYQISELEKLVIDTEKRLLQAIDSNLTDRLKGRILLQVEELGEAWYLDGETKKRYYLKDGDSAYLALGAFGLGISNNNLAKIPIGIEQRADLVDSDGDGLEDRLEDSLGTDIYNTDSDGDGFPDGTEVLSDYDPLGPGRTLRDLSFANSLKGRILLQVESAGEAWYVNPADGKRYYMSDGDLAYQIMRFQSLGISNSDLRKIAVGDFEY